MNDSGTPFGVYDDCSSGDGGILLTSCQLTDDNDSTAASFIAETSDWLKQTTSVPNYASTNDAPSLAAHYTQLGNYRPVDDGQQLHLQSPKQDKTNGDDYIAQVSFLCGPMDTQDDDFEPFTRDRCHTWPRLQQRPSLVRNSAGEDVDALPVSSYHDTASNSAYHRLFSPPLLQSRGSSALSLISESNENLASRDGWFQQGDMIAAGNFEDDKSPVSSLAPAAVSTPNNTLANNKRSPPVVSNYKAGHPSYVELITQAILSSPEKRMTLSEIYDWMVAHVESFKDQRHLHSSAGWKNSVRHNLSLHSRFKRVKRNGMDKPSWWTVDLTEETKRERSKRPKPSRPRANTTTAATRELAQQQQQRNFNHIQQQQQQPQRATAASKAALRQPASQDHLASPAGGHRSYSFSGALPPPAATGADIFVTGSAIGHSNTVTGSMGQLGSPVHDYPTNRPQSHLVDYSGGASGFMDDGNMEWSQYVTPRQGAVYQSTSVDSAVDESTSAVSRLSHAITVTLRDPPDVDVNGVCPKPDIVLNITTDSASTNDYGYETGGYEGDDLNNVQTVTNLVQALRQNTFSESGRCQKLRVQTGSGQIREVYVPVPMPIKVVIRTDKNCQTDAQTQTELAATLDSYLQMRTPPPLTRALQHEHQHQLALKQPKADEATTTLLEQLAATTQDALESSVLQLNNLGQPRVLNGFTVGTPSVRSPQPQPQPQHTACSSSVQQPGDLRRGRRGMIHGGGTLPDDLATLDINGTFDCNIMDVVRYEMNHSAANFA